jgi:hypothetical protein
MNKLILLHLLAFGSDTLAVMDCPHCLERLGTMETEALLEEVFRQANHVDNTEWIANKKLRSLSVGDVVILVIDNKVERWLVVGVGFEKIEDKK